MQTPVRPAAELAPGNTLLRSTPTVLFGMHLTLHETYQRCRHVTYGPPYTAESVFRITSEARTQIQTIALQRSLINVLQQELLPVAYSQGASQYYAAGSQK
ncbi:hypothetical protein WJX77_007610 [Trebouxia sp. C0004]